MEIVIVMGSMWDFVVMDFVLWISVDFGLIFILGIRGWGDFGCGRGWWMMILYNVDGILGGVMDFFWGYYGMGY